MRTAFLNLFRQSPFDGLKKHAQLIREVAPVFKKAFTAYLEDDVTEFESCHNKVTMIEDQGDRIKRNIRGHLPRGILLPMDKFKLLWYLREQDKVLDATQDTLHWLSYRKTKIPEHLCDDLLFMVEKIIGVCESVLPLVESAESYFQSFSEKHRAEVKLKIGAIRELEFQSDQVERNLLSEILSHPFDNATSAYHLSELVRLMGGVSNHAENAGDMMRAMIAR